MLSYSIDDNNALITRSKRRWETVLQTAAIERARLLLLLPLLQIRICLSRRMGEYPSGFARDCLIRRRRRTNIHTLATVSRVSGRVILCIYTPAGWGNNEMISIYAHPRAVYKSFRTTQFVRSVQYNILLHVCVCVSLYARLSEQTNVDRSNLNGGGGLQLPLQRAAGSPGWHL